MLNQYSVDGVIVASSTLPPAFSKAFRDKRIPVVNTFGRYSSSPEVHVVGIDNAEAGRMAARELVERGYEDGRIPWGTRGRDLYPRPPQRVP